ncbi:MAG: amino acid adenylation domain-containing protein [Anaerolineae bacterium]
MDKQNILAQRLKRAKRRDSDYASGSPSKQLKLQAPALSFAQERFWFLNQLEPENPLLNRPFAWRLTGALNLDHLELTVSAIVERHHILRTSYTAANSLPSQTLSAPAASNISVIDLTEQPLNEREEAAESQIKAICRTPIPLDSPVLVKTNLIKLSEADHVLLFVMHHVTFDALSEEIFKSEFCELYGAFSQNKQPQLPALPIQYAEFAQQQREALSGPKLTQLESFWTTQLAEAPHILALPTDHKRPTTSSNRGGTVTLTLPANLAHQTKQFSRSNEVTLFMTLLSAFYLLLNRYTQQSDILVGTPTSGRTLPGTHDLIGFFANTLVLRGDLSAEPTFIQFLSRIRSMALQSFEHQAYPVEKLFESIQVTREANIPPLFQVLFNLERLSPAKPLADGTDIAPYPLDFDSARFDLALEVQTDDGPNNNLICHFRYNRELFNQRTIERMASHYQTLLESALAQPNTEISQLPILTNHEREQLLYKWNATDLEYDTEMCIHQAFEQQALHMPHKIAVKDKERFLTYQQLNERSNQLARHLAKLGVGPEKLVGVYLERSLEMMVGLMAILKAGGAYVPIDPHLPVERAKFMLDDSAVSVVMTQKAWQNQLPDSVQHAICIDDLPAEVAEESSANFDSGVTPKNLIYVIYTSGSTGLPKGVMITHQNLYCYICARDHDNIFTGEDWLLQSATLSFDISAVQLFAAPVLGGRVVLAEPEGFRNIDSFLEIIAREKVTTINCPPSIMEQCIDNPKITECTSLRHGLVGGEALTTDLRDRFMAKMGVPLINGYGPTETTVGMMTHWCDAQSPYQTVPIGRPVPNAKVYILDKNLQPTPIGVQGEIFIGGSIVGRGYLNQPKLTAEKFIDNPFAKGRIYQTGDYGRYWADGNVEFLGRIDHQVKIRGFRIELGEIETALLEHPAVRQAKVMATDVNGSDQLVAYISTKQHQSTTLSNDLRQMISDKLPAYMVPTFIILMDQFPLMLSGKINLKALPKPAHQGAQSSDSFVEPKSSTEASLSKIWQDVLRVDQIGSNANFFELGGHSLLATQVITRIGSEFDIEFPLKTFFEAPKLSDQAFLIELMLDGF